MGITSCSRTRPWQWRVLLEARQGQPLHLRPPVKSAFPFTQDLFSAPGCPPPHPGGKGAVCGGDGSCFPAFAGPCLPGCDMIVSLGTVQRCQLKEEVSHASAIFFFFFKAKKKRLLNLGTLDLEVSLPGVGAGTLYWAGQSAPWARYPTWERFDSHPSAK